MGAFNGTGTFVRSFSWATDAANSVNISASRMDTEDNGFAGGLSNCITRDGQGGPTAAINWNGQNLTNVATFSTTGNATIGGTLGVTGVATFSNNASVGGTLSVTGSITFSTALTVPNGGTGATSFTAGKILKGNGASALAVAAMSEDGSGNVTTTGTLVVGGTILTVNGANLLIQHNGTDAFIRPANGGGSKLWLGANNTNIANVYSGGIVTGATSPTGIDTGGSANPGSVLFTSGNISAQVNNAGNLALSKASGFSDGNLAVFNVNGSGVGSISTNGSSTAYNTTSDQRLKTNIANAAAAGSILDSIQVRQFDWIADGSHQRYGMVAQELVTVFPEAVHVPADPNQMMAVDYSKLVPALLKELQSVRARLAAGGL